jgi:[acyl-carrier-protein] S-malonyltransferase
MAPAAERLAPELESAGVADPRIPVVGNVDAAIIRSGREVIPALLRQVVSPVRWTDCVRRLAAEGATTFVEVGSGRVLTGLLKRILANARGYVVEDPAGLDQALAEVRT